MGIVTGSASGFFVLDIDPDNGGAATMAALVAEHGTLPTTRCVRTGSGGWHYYFEMPDFEVGNSVGLVGKGIDIRGNGGQVVAPPSVSGKGPYALLTDAPVAPAPEWLLDLLRRPEPVTVPPAVAALPLRDTTPWERAAVAGKLKELANLASAGWSIPWEATTWHAAVRLIELANHPTLEITMAEAESQFLQHCPPPEPGYSPAAKWASARKRVGDKRATLPANMHVKPTAPIVEKSESPVPENLAALDPPKTYVPEQFFGKNGLLAKELALAVMDQGPIRMGQDERWWTYDPKGAWVEDRKAVRNRTIRLLRDRFRSAHATNAEQVVDCGAGRLVMDRPDVRYMNFTNGMLDWSAGTLKPHHPDYQSITPFPVAYIPTATCPKFDRFLESVLSPDYVRLAWEMLGYLLYSGNPLQKAFLLSGKGSNGKGTLIRVMQAMLGSENTSSLNLDMINNSRFAVADLFGKIANLAGDIDGTFQESTATFKMLTGEDRFTGEHKFGDSFTFNCWAVPVFSANKVPGSSDVSVGYLRRWIVLEFDHSFVDNPILGLSDQLIGELPGIVAKAITFLDPLLERRKFDLRGDAILGAQQFANSLDQTRQWVEDCCIIAPNEQVERTVLYQRYVAWSADNGTGKMSGSAFYERLESQGFAQRKVHGGKRVITGLALATPAGPATDPIQEFLSS